MPKGVPGQIGHSDEDPRREQAMRSEQRKLELLERFQKKANDGNQLPPGIYFEPSEGLILITTDDTVGSLTAEDIVLGGVGQADSVAIQWAQLTLMNDLVAETRALTIVMEQFRRDIKSGQEAHSQAASNFNPQAIVDSIMKTVSGRFTDGQMAPGEVRETPGGTVTRKENG